MTGGTTAGKKPRVLLVDDRADNLLALEAVLEPVDVDLVMATSGAEALEALLHDEFAVIVLDVQMPDIDGFETARLIKGRERTRLVPIIFLFIHRSGRRPAYPYALDITLGLPFLLDTLGNAFNLYDTVTWWDDLNHLVNWGILSAGFGLFLLMRPAVGKLSVAGLTVGFGAVTAILWEIAEYITFIRHSPELQTA